MSNHTKAELKHIAKEKELLNEGVSRSFIEWGLWNILGLKGARRIVKLWIKGMK